MCTHTKDIRQVRVPANTIPRNANMMFVAPITEEEVLNVTGKLKNKYSSGFDEIPASLIKHCIQFINKPLTFIFNLSLNTGTFPNLMKIAKVRPILKKGRIQDITNYRPISILPAFSKIFETLIHNRVISFLNKYNLISSAQNGFRANKSTYTAIQSFLEDILTTLDSKRFAMGVFLDLTKAFDVINHDRLLTKLDLYGLRGKIHEWMTSYLTNRFQYVEIYHQDHVSCYSKSFTSSLKEIKHGVPQGSVLGPLLFLLFINDLPHAIPQAKVVLFADDTNILFTDNSLSSLNIKIKKVIDQLESWFNVNQLFVNTDKTKVLFFHGKGSTSRNRPVIRLFNRELVYSSSVKFLGIDISENLSWLNHTQYICLKLSKALYLIKSLRNSVSLQVLRNVYFTKFESIFKYGIMFWGGGGKEIDTVFKVQKKMHKSHYGH
ncbi:hypothetical protein B7P43_G14318 [Cryptotermes secundus]|uniref:Reverse transcriptase domain-containing protein n=1 Tax=Cryptotermes secundus TaxID=105785 RepID=A0A2J7QD27_9NEOP|nr:hypothetical protein B7P43_G14318 [Cryptotermes secundus]